MQAAGRGLVKSRRFDKARRRESATQSFSTQPDVGSALGNERGRTSARRRNKSGERVGCQRRSTRAAVMDRGGPACSARFRWYAQRFPRSAFRAYRLARLYRVGRARPPERGPPAPSTAAHRPPPPLPDARGARALHSPKGERLPTSLLLRDVPFKPRRSCLNSRPERAHAHTHKSIEKDDTGVPRLIKNF